MQIVVTFLVLLSIFATSIALGEEDSDFSWGQKQNYITCSVISSEYLTALQLYSKGLPIEVALKSLPKISAEAKERVAGVYDLANEIGLLNAYSDINTNFARCSTLVNKLQGRPVQGDPQYGYYFCAGENKIRFEMILRILQKKTSEELYELFPSSHHNVLAHYLGTLSEKGVLSAFELTANNLKRCLQQIDE